MSDTPFALLVAQSILGLYGALYIATAIFAPRWFLDNLSLEQLNRRLNRHATPWWFWVLMALAALAIGIVVYAAIYAVVAIIPVSWGPVDEDGEWQSLRYSIQMFAGFWGGLALLGRLDDNARVLVWGPHERRARWVMTDLLSRAGHGVSDINEQILARLRTEFDPDDLRVRGYEKEHIEYLRRVLDSRNPDTKDRSK